jgi:hypothetical protein
MHPGSRRCSSLEYCPIFSVVAPCDPGASPVSVQRQGFTTGCSGFREKEGENGVTWLG